MKDSSSRYHFGDPDIDLYKDRQQLRVAWLGLVDAQRFVDETIIKAVDDGLSFAKTGEAIGVSKATAYRMYHEALGRRQRSQT